MVPEAYVLVLLVCFTMLLCNGVEGIRWNISAEEDLKFERQLKILNKPSIKSIFTVTGDIFDCVDFYKQPAFDHALINNYTIEYEYKPRSLHTTMKGPLDIGTKSDECPNGSVAIRRITKEDLIRERQAFKVRNFVDNNTPRPGTHYAIVRTKPGVKLFGAGSTLSIWRPEVSSEQYSGGRMKVSNGLESIEAGWRVDPILYGDGDTHLYIRTEAGQSHCFDARCGFVVLDQDLAVGRILGRVSRSRGHIHNIQLFIVKDTGTDNWFLEFNDHKRIGFWPKGLFASLAESGSSAEWGGEVFTPLGTSLPMMGAGTFQGKGEYFDDAIFRQMTLFDGQNFVNAGELDSVADTGNYKVRDGGIVKDPFFSHLMFYGGTSRLPP